MRQRTRWAAVAVAAALAAPVIGAATAYAVPEPRTSADVCTMVPKKLLELGTGNPLQDGIAAATPVGNGSCRFAPANEADGITVELTISTHRQRDARRTGYPFGDRTAFDRIYGPSKRISGVGKHAWFAYERTISHQAALLAVKRNVAVQVVLNGGIETSSLARKRAFAIATVALKVLTLP
jgi:hypothetical protein